MLLDADRGMILTNPRSLEARESTPVNPSSTKLRLYRAGQLTLSFAAAAIIASACATVVEEDPGLTTGPADTTDTETVGPVTTSAQATGPGNTTTVNTSTSSTSGGNGNGNGAGNNNASNDTTGNTSGTTTGGALGGTNTGNAANAGNTTSSTTAAATTGNATTGGATTGAPFGGNNTTGGTATSGGAGGAGNTTGAPFGGFGATGEAAATTGSASCEADAWESGKTTTDSNGNAYSEGDLVEYMGVVYSVDQDQNYGHPMCPPDGSGETWCATQYSFTPVEGC